MKACFVTCLYHGLDGTKYGGRNRYTMYVESLVSISKTNVPIYCYIFDRDYESLTSYFAERGINNIKLISHDILAEDFHNTIMNIKDSNPELYYGDDIFWKSRCPEIMYGKTRLITKTIQDHPQFDSFFWIDAGLSNSSVMRHKYFPEIHNAQHHHSEGIFTENFIQSLVDFASDKILALLHTMPNNFRLPERYNQKPYGNDNYAMIAGLFGGKSDLMLTFSQKFEEYLSKTFASGELFAEESIYTGIVNDNPEMFNSLKFDTFYNEDWADAYSKHQVSFASIIDKFI